MRAIPSSVWKLTALAASLGILATWTVWVHADDEQQPQTKPAPAASAPQRPAERPAANGERFGVAFDRTPWQPVIEWFAKVSGLAFVGTEYPTGSFTFTAPDPNRKYTIPEIVDILNEGLQAKNYTLLRRSKSFTLVSAESQIDPGLVPRIDIKDLDKYGDSELVSVVFPVMNLDAESLAPGIEKLLGPLGKVAAVSATNQLVIQDTGRNIKRVKDVIQQDNEKSGASMTFTCKYIKARDAAAMLRDMLGLPKETSAAAPAVDPRAFDRDRARFAGGFQGREFMQPQMQIPAAATGGKRPTTVYADERLNQVFVSGGPDVLAQAERFLKAADVAQPGQKEIVPGQMESKIYTVPSGSADAIAKMLKEIYKNSKIIMIETGGSNSVVVFAPAHDQAEIGKRILDTTDAASKTKRMPLNNLDAPHTADRIKEMLSIDPEKSGSLYVGSEPESNSLIVRGTESQVADIENILRVLGEGQGGSVRIIPIRGNVTTKLQEVQRMMQQDRGIPVKINIVNEPQPSTAPRDNNRRGGPRADPPEEPAVKFGNAQPVEAQDKAAPVKDQQKPQAQVTISVVGDKVIITCDDPETLNYAHQVVRTFINPPGLMGDAEVIPLKRTSAVEAAKVLDEFFNGPKQNLMQQNNPLQQMLRGRGAQMPMIPPVTPAPNKIRIVADPATNSLLVRAGSSDRRIINELVKTMEGGPEDSDALMKPYIIGPFKNTTATEVANVIRDVYAEYMGSAPSNTLVGGMRGFGGQFRGGSRGRVDANGNPMNSSLSVAVDDRGNSLIVNCTKSMYDDILALADRLDDSASSASRTIRVVSSKGLDPFLAQQAVAAMQGQSISSMTQPGGMMNNMGMNPMMGRGNQGGGQMGGMNPMMGRGNTFSQTGGFNPAMMGNTGRGNMMMPGGMQSGSPRGAGNMMQSGGGMRPGGGGGGMRPGGGRTSRAPDGGPDFFGQAVKDDQWFLVLYDPQLDRERDNSSSRTNDSKNDIQLASFALQQPAPLPQTPTPALPPGGDNIQAPRSAVTLEPLSDLGVFIVTGNNQADVEAVLRLIELLRQLGTGAQLKFEIVPLTYGEPTSVAAFLSQIFQAVTLTPNSTTQSRQPQQQQQNQNPLLRLFTGSQQQTAPQGSVGLYPIPRLNAIFVIAPEARIADVKEEIRKLDRPIANAARPVQIFLKKASATQVATLLTTFFSTNPYGDPNQPRVSVNADVPSNSLLVLASPADLATIREMVTRLDTKESGAINELKIVPLTNMQSADLAALLQQAINQAVAASAGAATGARPTTPQAPLGFQQPGAATQNTTGGTTTKNVTIRFTLPNGQTIQSGWLEDVYILSADRTNSLIVMAPERTMELIVKLIKELDVLPKLKSDLKVIALTKADATNTATLLQQLFLGSTQAAQPTGGQPGGFPNQGGFPNTQGRTTQGTTSSGATGSSTISGGEGAPVIPLQITVDQRTNSIIVAGSPGDVDLIWGLIQYLDDLPVQTRQTQVYILRNSTAADIANALTTFYSGVLAVISRGGQLPPFQSYEQEIVIVPEPIKNALLISATPKYFGQVMQAIQELDYEPPQVMVYALIAQIDLNGSEEFGVEFGLQSPVLFQRSIVPAMPFIGSSTGTIDAANGATLVPAGVTLNTTNPVAQPGFNFNNSSPLGNNPYAPGPGIVGFQGINGLGVGRNTLNQSFGGFVFSAASDSFSLLVRALKTQGRLQILSRPQLMALDNQSAGVQVGQDYPYVSATNVNLGVVTNTVTYRSIGVTLTLTPKISPDGKIFMRVKPEISSVGVGTIDIGGGATAVPFNVQVVETTVMAQDGETVVIGGLISHRDNKAQNSIPWLGELPGIGALFRYRTQTKNKSELVVILTPRIIYNRMDTEAILAEETRKMDWMWGDVMRLYDVPAMKSLAPPPNQKNGDCPPDGGKDLLPPPNFATPGPTLGDPVIGEPLPAPRSTPQQSDPRMQPQADPTRPQPMPDGPAANMGNGAGRFQGKPTSMTSAPASPVGVFPRAPRPMPNSQ